MNTIWLRSAVACAALAAAGSTACSRDVQAVSPQELQQRYGITDAYAGQVATADGTLRGTLVPVTLPDGRRAELVIPDRSAHEPHAAYFRDADGLHPIEIADNVQRAQVTEAPVVVSRGTERHPQHRSWEKEALIIGGSAGAGTAVGALTGGKKGAGIGAAAGGIGGLIYDLATRKHQ